MRMNGVADRASLRRQPIAQENRVCHDPSSDDLPNVLRLITDRDGDLRKRIRWDRDQPARRTANQPDVSDRTCRLNSADVERRGGWNLFGQGIRLSYSQCVWRRGHLGNSVG